GRLPNHRFTPTRVGKTHKITSTGTSNAGSPPRVWGKRGQPLPRRVGQRFTPTRVGKTGVVGRANLPKAVHPHACGENQRHARRARLVLRFTPTRVGKTHMRLGHRCHRCGSPPRVWGKRTSPPPRAPCA